MARNPLNTITVSSFLLTMLCGAISWAGTVSLGAANAVQGDTAVEVPLHFTAEPGEEVAGIQVDILFDGAALEISAAYEGASATAADKDVRLSLLDEDTARIIIAGFNQNLLSDGEVAVMEFSIANDAAPGAYPVVLEALLLSDPFGQDISSTAINGSITVTPGPGGDDPLIGCFSTEEDQSQSASVLPSGLGGVLLAALALFAIRRRRFG
jgi:MYXO-CTERM domain-containing protein